MGKVTLYMIWLRVGFETNLNVMVEMKHDKYLQLTHGIPTGYCDFRFINLSLRVLGIFSKSCKCFIYIYEKLDF